MRAAWLWARSDIRGRWPSLVAVASLLAVALGSILALMRLLDGPAYPAELADLLGTGRANVSNHLACLRGCGLVIAEREGRFVRYQVAHPDLADALRLLTGVPLATEADHADMDGRR